MQCLNDKVLFSESKINEYCHLFRNILSVFVLKSYVPLFDNTETYSEHLMKLIILPH